MKREKVKQSMTIQKFKPSTKFTTYRNGGVAEIIYVDRKNTLYCVLSLDNEGNMIHHLANGRVNLSEGADSPRDLIL